MELFLFLKTSIIIMRCDFESESFFSNMLREIQNKNSQREMNLEKENQGDIDASISNRIQEIE